MRGSKPGEYRGGRKKGTPNKVTQARAAAIAKSGLSPLDFMLAIMRGEAAPEDASIEQKIAFHTLRFEAAKAAAPYVHPRLATTELVGNKDRPIAARIEQVIVDCNQG